MGKMRGKNKLNIRASAMLFFILLIALLFIEPLSIYADDFNDNVDIGTTLLGPTLYYILDREENKDPNNTILIVDEISGQVITARGNLNRLAEYVPLSSGIKVRGLFYLKALNSNLFTLQVDSDGTDSRKISAGFKKPGIYSFNVKDTKILHRLVHNTKGVDIDLDPTSPYYLTWEMSSADGDINLNKGGGVRLYGGFAYQIRSGNKSHSFFQLHRANCTDCHSVQASRGINQTTQDWKGGFYAKLTKDMVIDAHVRSSEFKNNGPVLTYNFGGPFGSASALYPSNSSRDNYSGYQFYAGKGQYRFGVYGASMSRNNITTGHTVKNYYLSTEGAVNPTDNLVLNAGGYYTKKRDTTFNTNLSTAAKRLYFQTAYNIYRGLNVIARVGQDERDYSVIGIYSQDPHPTAKNRYIDVKGTYNPGGSNWKFQAQYRKDYTSNPYFLTNSTRKTKTNLTATYSFNNVIAGMKYEINDSNNTINVYNQNEFVAFMSAQLKNNILFNSYYSSIYIDSNYGLGIYMNDPAGSDRLLQTGYPYWSKNNQFMTSLVIPLGKKNIWRITPMYRWSLSQSNADLLPEFLEIPLDSRQKILQRTYSLNLNFPLKKDGTSIGVGWEYNKWEDQAYNGSYNNYMINFSKQF